MRESPMGFSMSLNVSFNHFIEVVNLLEFLVKKDVFVAANIYCSY